MTSGLHRAIASAAAIAISIPILFDITYPSSILYHLYGTRPAFHRGNIAVAIVRSVITPLPMASVQRIDD